MPERDLRLYLARNLECIEPGLNLYETVELKGLEFDAEGRRIDIPVNDRNGAFVVIELKVSKGCDQVVKQRLRYVNWVRQNLAEKPTRSRHHYMQDDVRRFSFGMFKYA